MEASTCGADFRCLDTGVCCGKKEKRRVNHSIHCNHSMPLQPPLNTLLCFLLEAASYALPTTGAARTLLSPDKQMSSDKFRSTITINQLSKNYKEDAAQPLAAPVGGPPSNVTLGAPPRPSGGPPHPFLIKYFCLG
ncbi:hypothetical protein Emag_002182 [Eimeria magna]